MVVQRNPEEQLVVTFERLCDVSATRARSREALAMDESALTRPSETGRYADYFLIFDFFFDFVCSRRYARRGGGGGVPGGGQGVDGHQYGAVREAVGVPVKVTYGAVRLRGDGEPRGHATGQRL